MLIPLLDHSNGEVRAEVAFALGEMGTNSARLQVQLGLVKLLGDSHPHTRQEATFALWRITGNTNMIGLLITELKTASNLEGVRIFSHFCQMRTHIQPAIPIISNVIVNSSRLSSLTNNIWRLDASLLSDPKYQSLSAHRKMPLRPVPVETDY